MAGCAIQAMQLQVFLEPVHAQHALECAIAHFGDMAEAHVIRDQRDHLIDVRIRKSQPRQYVARDALAQLHMAVKANALGNAKSSGLANIVQQYTKASVGVGCWRPFQHY